MIRANLKSGSVNPIYRGNTLNAIKTDQTLTPIIANASVSSSNSGTVITGISGSHRLLVYFSNPQTSHTANVTMSLNGVQLMSETLSSGANQVNEVKYTFDQNVTLTGNDTLTFTGSGDGVGSVLMLDLY